MRSRGRRRSPGRSIFLGVLLAFAAAPFTVAAAEQTNPITLPPVIVTAPFVPLYLRPGNGLKAFERNPYFGDNRVEESRFAPVSCSGFRVEAAAAGAADRTCLQGYRLVPANVDMPDSEDERDSGDRCEMEHDVTIYNIGNLSVEADVLLFDPYKLTADGGSPAQDCYVAAYSGYDRDDFQDMNRITRQGSDWHDLRGRTCQWSDLRPACETKSIEFSYGPHKCIAVRRPGPRWRGGFVWMLSASICRIDTASLQQGDVARALGAVQIRQYDPVGNIARPSK